MVVVKPEEKKTDDMDFNIQEGILNYIASDKSGYPHNIILISPREHMLWIPIRSTSVRRF